MTIQSHTEQSSTVSSQETIENAAPKLNPEFKAKWLAALRSGEYQQCQEALTKDGGYCCIGVAALVAGYEIDTDWDRVVRPDRTSEDEEGYCALSDFGLTERSQVIHMNDIGKSFEEIAQYIEANL